MDDFSHFWPTVRQEVRTVMKFTINILLTYVIYIGSESKSIHFLALLQNAWFIMHDVLRRDGLDDMNCRKRSSMTRGKIPFTNDHQDTTTTLELLV